MKYFIEKNSIKSFKIFIHLLWNVDVWTASALLLLKLLLQPLQ